LWQLLLQLFQWFWQLIQSILGGGNETMAITYSLVATDWTVDNITGNIRYTGDDHHETSPSYATVIELHRWLGQLADDQAPADTSDKMYIPIPKASERSTDNIITLVNGFNIDATAAEHLYDGSIIQNGGDEIWDGIVNFGNASVQIQIIQDGAIIADDFWNYNYGGTATGGSGTQLADTGASWDIDEWIGYTIKNITDDARGIASDNDGTTIDFPSGELYGTGTLDFSASDAYRIGQPLNPDSAQGISHRFLIKVREDGADIDGRRLIGICRRPGNTFAWFPINGTSRGNNVLALSDAADLNYDTANQTVMGATWDSEFSGEDQGFQQFDVDDDGNNEDYFGKLTWTGTHDINDLYMRAMGETCDHGGYTVHGLDGEILRGVTHSIGYDTETGGISISDYDMLVWGTYINTGAVTGGPFTVGEVVYDNVASPSFFARVLSVDGTDTSLVVSIDSGTLGNGVEIIGASSGATATTSADPTEVTGGGVLHVLAHDATNDILYVQVIKGTMCATDVTLYYGGTNLATADHTDYVVSETGIDPLTEFTISKTAPYIGVSTGSAIIGAHGVGIDDAKLNSSDSVIPLGESTPINPPLTVTNTYSGLDLVNPDQILVAPTDGTTVDVNGDPTIGAAYFTIKTALTGAAETTVYVDQDLADSDIDTWLPSSGYIDIVNDEGLVVTHAYSAYSGAADTFTISSYDFSGSGVNDSVSVGNYAYVYQMHLTTALTTGAETSAIVNEIIGSTPDSGTIRIVNDDGFHIRHPYSAYDDATDTFTITSADFSGDGLTEQASIGSGVYVTYIDKAAASASETFTAVYDVDLNLTVVVRDGGGTPIKEDKRRHTFTNSNASLGITRTSDT